MGASNEWRTGGCWSAPKQPASRACSHARCSTSASKRPNTWGGGGGGGGAGGGTIPQSFA